MSEDKIKIEANLDALNKKRSDVYCKDYDVFGRARERLAEHLFGDAPNLPSFPEALKILNIEDYSERIWTSNSRGELGHTFMYCEIARVAKETGNTSWFRDWFEKTVEYAEKNWERPESVFQHIDKLLEVTLESAKTNYVKQGGF